MIDLNSILGGGAGGAAILVFVISGLRRQVNKKVNQESCNLIQKSLNGKLDAIEKRLDKVDMIHETVIRMEAKLMDGGK